MKTWVHSLKKTLHKSLNSKKWIIGYVRIFNPYFKYRKHPVEIEMFKDKGSNEQLIWWSLGAYDNSMPHHHNQIHVLPTQPYCFVSSLKTPSISENGLTISPRLDLPLPPSPWNHKRHVFPLSSHFQKEFLVSKVPTRPDQPFMVRFGRLISSLRWPCPSDSISPTPIPQVSHPHPWSFLY